MRGRGNADKGRKSNMSGSLSTQGGLLFAPAGASKHGLCFPAWGCQPHHRPGSHSLRRHAAPTAFRSSLIFVPCIGPAVSLITSRRSLGSIVRPGSQLDGTWNSLAPDDWRSALLPMECSSSEPPSRPWSNACAAAPTEKPRDAYVCPVACCARASCARRGKPNAQASATDTAEALARCCLPRRTHALATDIPPAQWSAVWTLPCTVASAVSAARATARLVVRPKHVALPAGHGSSSTTRARGAGLFDCHGGARQPWQTRTRSSSKPSGTCRPESFRRRSS